MMKVNGNKNVIMDDEENAEIFLRKNRENIH